MKLYLFKQLKTLYMVIQNILLVKNGLLEDHVDTNLMSELKLLKKRQTVSLDKNEGVYIRDIRSGEVKLVSN